MDGIRIENDVKQIRERFMFSEHFVLLPIICLSLLRGMAVSVDSAQFFGHIKTGELTNSIFYHDILYALGPLPAIVLVTFISEICGRKPVFNLLFALCALSSVLSYLSYQQPWAMMGNFIVAAIKGGVLSISYLAICEYSSPKHRLAYLVTNEVVKIFSSQAMKIMYDAEVLSKESSYLSLCGMFVALACLVSVYWWPESPYWLAQRGRREEAAAAMRRLRGEGAEAGQGSRELRALHAKRRRRSRKLFWLALLISLISITVSNCASSGIQILYLVSKELTGVVPQLSHTIITACSTLVVSLVLVLVSYRVKRKVLYLSATVVPFALVCILSVCIHAEQVNNHGVVFYIMLSICIVLLQCGPFSLSLMLSIELIPQKYYTFISCISSIYFGATTFIFFKISFSYRYNFPLYGFLLVFASLALAGLAMLYWLSPETRNRNLFEIEETYLRRLYDKNLEQVQMEDLPR